MRLVFCMIFPLISCGILVAGQPGKYSNASYQTTASSSAFSSGASLSSHRMCAIYAATVRVLYFPPENATSRYASTLVSSNYTFTYPSFYVVYSTINAVDTVAPDYHATQAGGIYYNVTRAYPPGGLQTMPAACYHGFGIYKTLEVEDLIHPPQNWITDQQCNFAMGGSQDGSQFPDPNSTEQAAFPDISLPADMSAYDPAWSGCTQDTADSPLWDPPRVLTPGGVMIPSTTSHGLSLPSSTADPGWRPPDSLPDTRSAATQTTPGASIGPGGPPKISQSASIIPGAMTSTNGEHDISGQSPGNVYGGATIEYEDPSSIAVPPSSVVVGHHTVYALPDGELSVNGMTMTAGGSAITVDEVPVSLDESVLYVAGSSFISYLPAAAPSLKPPPVGGHEVKAEPSGEIAIGDSTIARGSKVTIAGNPISVDSLHVIIGTKTYAKPTMPGASESGFRVTDSLQNSKNRGGNPAPADTTATSMITPPPFPPSLGNQKLSTLANGAIVVGTSTFSPGAQGAFSGTPISVGSRFVVVGGSTFDLAVSRPTGSAPLVGGQTIQRASDGDIIIGSLTLSQGFHTTISGTPVFVESKSIILDGTSYQLPSTTGNRIEINGQSIERLPSGDVVVDGHTISVDAQTTISGLPISIGAIDVAIAGSTYELDYAGPSTPTDGIGAMIASVFGFVSLSSQSRSRAIDSGTFVPTGSEPSHLASESANLSTSASSSGFAYFVGASASLDVNFGVLLITALCNIAVGAFIHTI